MSLIGLLDHEQRRTGHKPPIFNRRSPSGGLAAARNVITRGFLEATDCRWLLFVDSDMGFEPNLIERLLDVAHPHDRPVVGGLYFGHKRIESEHPELSAPTFRMFPMLHTWDANDLGFAEITDYPRDSLVKVDATGAGCILAHRSVFERIAEDEGPHWWSEILHPNRDTDVRRDKFSEDMSFCLRCTMLKVPIHVDTSVKTAHDKGGAILTEDVWDDQQRLAAMALAQSQAPNIAIIPVKDRRDLTADLLADLRRDGDCDRIIVCDNGSKPATANWLRSQPDLTVIDCPDAGIHEMWNRGAEEAMAQAPQCNLHFLNNDIRLGEHTIAKIGVALRSDDRLLVAGANYDGRDGEGVQYVTDICAQRYDGTGGLAGFCFAVKSEFFAVGYRFPEECKWWYGDNDLVLSAGASGAKVGIVLDATCEHIGGGSQTGGDWSAQSEQLKLDRKHFVEKWSA